MKKMTTLVLVIALLLFMFIIPSYAGTASVTGGLSGPGIWLNTVPDASLPGFFQLKFNASKSFSSIKIMIYSSVSPASSGSWKLYKFNTNDATTLAGTPVASGDLNRNKDDAAVLEFGTQAAGQYIFYIEQDDLGEGSYFNLGVSKTDYDAKKFAYDYNGTLFGDEPNKASPFLFAEFTFEGDGTFFADLIPDGEANVPTGDISLISLAGLALVTSLTKKRKVK